MLVNCLFNPFPFPSSGQQLDNHGADLHILGHKARQGQGQLEL
jgi:hypothetical protein